MHNIFCTNMTYTRSQNYTNVVVGKLEIQTFKVVIATFWCCCLIFSPTNAHLLLFLDKWFVQIYLNVSNYTLMLMDEKVQVSIFSIFFAQSMSNKQRKTTLKLAIDYLRFVGH